MGRVPPAVGVIVNAAAFAAGLRTVSVEFAVALLMITVPVISDVPVALPKTA